MAWYTRTLLAACILGTAFFPLANMTYGLGHGPLEKAEVVNAALDECPTGSQRTDGTCYRTHRSRFYRSFSGGGTSGGK
ncbi:MAG: hypothetical protein HOE53_01490 [Candidatus Magasanikbacteria bacterium]|jgi:hypothetical protein|nr:hypothetical protein [Candidatus Magasanikbacteria bacterium]